MFSRYRKTKSEAPFTDLCLPGDVFEQYDGKIVIEFPPSFVQISSSPNVSDCTVGGESVSSGLVASTTGQVVTVTLNVQVSAGQSVSFLVGNMQNEHIESNITKHI